MAGRGGSSRKYHRHSRRRGGRAEDGERKWRRRRKSEEKFGIPGGKKKESATAKSATYSVRALRDPYPRKNAWPPVVALRPLAAATGNCCSDVAAVAGVGPRAAAHRCVQT